MRIDGGVCYVGGRGRARSCAQRKERAFMGREDERATSFLQPKTVLSSHNTATVKAFAS